MVELSQNPAVELFKRGGGIEPPPEVILSWPKPNYINPESHGWAGPIVLIIVIALTVVVFLARLWARQFMSKNAGLDDALIAAAMIPLIGLTIAAVLACRVYGFQWHAWDQTAWTYVTTREITLAIELLYMGATSLTKISILCFYRRMSSGSISSAFIYGVWGLIISVIIYYVVFTFVILFTCTPVEGFWHLYDIAWRTQNELHCRDEGIIIVTIVVISTLQDFIICALPVVLVWNLQIPKRQKLALMALFGMGVLTCICGVMRTYYAIYVYYYTYDITWYAWYGWIWTAVEADLGVVCASAPAMKVFFQRYLAYTSRGSSGNGYSGRKTGSGLGSYLKKSYGRLSAGNSLGTSLTASASRHDYKVSANSHVHQIPLDRIQVRSHTAVRIESAMDTARRSSQDSSSSTHILRVPPSSLVTPERSPVPWVGSRTTCERASKDYRDLDIERMAGAAMR